MLFDFLKRDSRNDNLVEALASYKNKGGASMTSKQVSNISGEGYDDISFVTGYGKESLQSFNNFYNKNINVSYQNELSRLQSYRVMAEMPEISSVIEDIVIESTQEDAIGRILSLEIIDEDLKSNDNIVNNLTKEFEELFFNNIHIDNYIWDFFRSYYVDGKIYIERVNTKTRPSLGVINLKKLPSETMDSVIDENGRVEAYYQYLTPTPKKPKSIEDALQDDKIVVFYPEQITYIDYGLYGKSKKDVLGYLEKVKQPFNQLRLLETSVIIYRLVRSPERLVFRIDTGAMPRDKAMKFVDKIRRQLTQKVSYDTNSGQLENQPDVMSMLDNFFLPQCLRLDTKISCLDGKDKTLSQMIDDFNNGIKNEVLSVDQLTGKIIKGDVEWAGITRKDAELVRVHLDSGDYIDVTPDHKFVMRDGSEVEAQHLNHNDSLMPYYTRYNKICSTSNDYKQVYDLCDNEWKFMHRIVKPVTKGNVVHHQDINRYNNMSNNLIEMGSLDHFIYHSSLGSDNLKKLWMDDDFSEMMIETVKNTANKKWLDQSERDKQSDRMSQYWKDNYDVFYHNVSKPKTNQHKQSLSKSITEKWTDNEYRLKSSLSSKRRWDNKDFRNHMSDVKKGRVSDKLVSIFTKLYIDGDTPSMDVFINTLSNNDNFMDEWSSINSDKKSIKKSHLGKTGFYNIIKYMGFDNYTEFKKGVTINHKVDFVEVLDIREDTGCLTIKDTGNNHNFSLSIGVFVKNSSDGRGSSIESIGGNASGFAEIDDIWYFSRKLYTALKYPMSRVANMQEGRSADNMFMGQNSEINRDEIRWAKFLERHQSKFTQEFETIFLLHLEFKGLKKEYDLDFSKFNITMTPPNNFKDQMNQMALESKMGNYQNFANNPEFSKTYLMKTYLDMDEDELKANADGFLSDKKMIPADEY